jgi:hypothetical protein
MPMNKTISMASDLHYQARIKSGSGFGRVASRIGNDAGFANRVIAAAVDVAMDP